jgi:Protein of unknown function (DUF3006)
MESVISASLDRIEGEIAVLYSDNDDHKFDVPLNSVKGAKPGMRLHLHIENDRIKHIEIDKEATERARNRIRKKYNKLRRGRHLKQK